MTQPEPNISSSVIRQTPGEGWVWAPRIDPNCGEYGLFVNQNNHLNIAPGSNNAAITGMRIILNNQFAPMPVCGHSYASAQFIGRGSTEVSMQIAGIGDEKISDIQAMYEELGQNARIFRRFEGAARVRFSGNEFLRLAGINDGIITSVDTETDSEGTNLYRCQISFTSDGHHTEGFRQEIYVENDTLQIVLEGLLQRVITSVISPDTTRILESEESLESILQTRLSQTGGNLGSAVAGDVQEVVAGTTGTAGTAALGWYLSYLRSNLRQRGYNRAANLTSVSGILEAVRTELNTGLRVAGDFISEGSNYVQNQSRRGAYRRFPIETIGLRVAGDFISGGSDYVQNQSRRGAYLRFPIETAVPRANDDSAVYTVNSDPSHPWIDRYVQQIVDILHEWLRNLPGSTFFRGPLRGKYLNYRNRGPATEDDDTGTRTEWEGLEGQITNWPPMLGDETSVLCGMIHGRRRRWMSLRNSSVTGRDSIEGNLFEFEQELASVAQMVLVEAQGEPDFNEVFPGITERWVNSRRFTAHPTYPDLGLPPHPVTGLVIDTEPDFYFFNDGEEGFLNEIGPEIVDEIDTRLQNMEETYARLASGQEWSETYLGRSRVAVSGYEEGDNTSLAPRDSFDGSTNLSIDGTTVEGEDNQIAANWGPEGGRTIGGRSSPIEGSIVDQVIGMSPTIRGIDGGSNIERTARRVSMMRNTSFSLPTSRPESGVGIGPIDTALGVEDRAHTFSRNALRTIVQQSIAQAPENTLTMRRAFPSFKIYFIEDDTGAMRDHLLPSGGAAGAIRPIMYFDDLYNYNSVKSIRLIRSRKNPADLLILQLTNVQGLLERKRWTAPGERGREIYAPGFEETEMENPLKKLIMKEGLKVQARLGYSNNPLKMGVKFIGEVVEFSFNAEVADEVTIICQGYGAELTLERKGISEGARSHFIDTPDLLHTVMCSPELVHFGRFELNPQFNPGEARSAATSRRDPSTGTEGTGRLIRNPMEIIQDYQDILSINRSKWILANNPSDDNIFAPGVRDHLSGWERFTDDVGAQAMWGADWIEAYAGLMRQGQNIGALGSIGLTFRGISTAAGWIGSGVRSLGEWLNDGGIALSGQTIWEILKECELRHPGWVAAVRPYGTRATVFFGVPSHRYWSDQISREEMLVLQRLRTLSEMGWRLSPEGQLATASRLIAGTGGMAESGPGFGELAALSNGAQYLYLRTCFELASNRWLADAGEYIGSTLGRFKPFRRYHLLTSDHHILLNNIRASKKGTFNAVSLQYGSGEIYTLKADDSIPDELTRVQTFSYPSCDNETLARRYCIGLLNRHLKDVYKGEIIVTGMDVDPMDICYIRDERLGMHGAFEVEQVVDTFTPETGWITEITPDMITGTNEWATRSTAEARMAAIGALGERYMGFRLGYGSVAGAGVASVALPAILGTVFGPTGTFLGAGAGVCGAALAWMGGYHFIRWTQDRQPIWVCPLILGERPFFSGLDGFRQDGVFASIRGKLYAEFDAVSEGWRQFHLAGFANDLTVSVARTVAGQGGGA